MEAMVPKWQPLIDMGVINLNSKFQLWCSSNSWDMDNWISKMDAIGKPAKPTQNSVKIGPINRWGGLALILN